MEKRIVYLDIIRCVACCMIVLMHAPHVLVPGYIQVPLYFMTAAGIGLFFMVSGALLLPVKMETGAFLKRRMGKIVGPLLFWTFFYVGVKLWSGEMTIHELPLAILSIPFSAQGHGVLWFMYTLAGLYLLSPIISAFLVKASRVEIRFYLLLWVVTLCLPLLSLVLDVNSTTTGVLYYFTGYVGYFILGYYLHKFKTYIKSFVLVSMFLIPLILLFIHRYYGLKGDVYDLFWYLSITVATLSVAWFIGVQKITGNIQIRESNLLTEFSNACFGIYLMHIFVMRRVLWNIDFLTYGLGWIGQLLTSWLVSLVISFVLTYVISLLPYSQYLIGYSNYNKT